MATGAIPYNGWKEVDHKTGRTDISLTGVNFSELLLVVNVDNGDNLMSAVLPKVILKASNEWIRMGGYSPSSTSTMATVYVSTSVARITTVYVNSTDKSSTSVLYVYYR